MLVGILQEAIERQQLGFYRLTNMAAGDGDDSLYPIAVLIDELRNEDVQVDKQYYTFLDGFSLIVKYLSTFGSSAKHEFRAFDDPTLCLPDFPCTSCSCG